MRLRRRRWRDCPQRRRADRRRAGGTVLRSDRAAHGDREGERTPYAPSAVRRVVRHVPAYPLGGAPDEARKARAAGSGRFGSLSRRDLPAGARAGPRHPRRVPAVPGSQLTDQSDLGRLASDLFEYEDVRVLLLSATPYKMYTLSAEAKDENHYEDFVRTFKFLQPDPGEIAAFESLLDEFRRELFRLGRGSLDRLLTLKRDIEGRLRSAAVRTERLAVTQDRDGMLREAPRDGLRLSARDVASYPSLRKVAAALEAGDVLEFWKSAPYLLNFMENYQSEACFPDAARSADERGRSRGAPADAPDLLLPWKEIAAYGVVDPGHAGLRKLVTDTVDSGMWRLLWVPPSLPYYQLSGPFAEPAAERFTKRLVFSAWHVVPKAITCLLSYEAERAVMRSFESDPKNTPDERKRPPAAPPHRPVRRAACRSCLCSGWSIQAPTLAAARRPARPGTRREASGTPSTLEQREGRVHRFKGHAVRKNLATKFRLGRRVCDRRPVGRAFSRRVSRNAEPGCSDLVPFCGVPA